MEAGMGWPEERTMECGAALIRGLRKEWKGLFALPVFLALGGRQKCITVQKCRQNNRILNPNIYPYVMYACACVKCSVCVCLCVCYAHFACSCMYMQRLDEGGALLHYSLPHFSETGSLAEPVARLSLSKAQQSCPLTPQFWHDRHAVTWPHPAIYVVFMWDLNSYPHGCIANSLTGLSL